ncbi:hypothetical protein BS17DRAFT_769405 [Gyrodon lividus]|nr:hypothetical protein BS17DRAFT_769405 [Gyrodon lividus]
MTSFVQPLDAGIICCFKAHYHHAFCLHADELDEAGDTDIYKINLLEVMLMVKEAWAKFNFREWKAAFDEILKAEDNESAAVAAIEALKEKAITHHTHVPVPLLTHQSHHPSLPELERAKTELMQAVNSFCKQKHIQGTCPTLKDLLNPSEEKERKRDTSGDEGDESKELEITPQQGMGLCLSVERLCLQYSDVNGLAIHPLQSQLQKLHSHLQKVDFESHTQVTLDHFFIPTQDR